MAGITKDVCILDIRELQGGLCSIRFCIWLAVTNPYPAPNAVSAYLEINTDPNVGPVSQGGQGIPAALIAGTIIEEVHTLTVPMVFVGGSQWATVVEPYIAAMVTARVKYRGGTAPAVPDFGLKYKILHDSATGWSA